MWLAEQSHYSLSLGLGITTIKTFNKWEMVMNKRIFFFFFERDKQRDDGLNESPQAGKDLIFVCEAMKCWNRAPSTRWSNMAGALQGETWRTTYEAGCWQREGRGEDRGSMSPCTAQRNCCSPLNGTFPLNDMRSQNLVKWPLGN